MSLPDTAIVSALLVGAAVALPPLARLIPSNRAQASEVFCRTGLRWSSEEERSKYARKLAQAGIDRKPEWFTGMRLSLLGVFLIACVPMLLLGMNLFWMVLLAPFLYAAPDIWLNGKISKRKSEIRLALPDYTLFLSTALAAGTDIRLALREAAGAVGGPLKEETERALLDSDVSDIKKARTFGDALSDMAERCDVDELRALVRVLAQADRYGTPLATIMRDHSEQMRTARRFEVMESANKLSVKLVFPVLMFLLGPCMIAIGYPALVSLLSSFNG